ncbi:hypothetical protein ACIBEJ_00525 [Nonomuraea sp. NPDC050790]|uniref:hypothetical protein n=1 Tax=Nonomuraea sp. NPDC050790 TaxID=3364371 RepID=UPI003794D553
MDDKVIVPGLTAGAANTRPRDPYHEVVAIDEPGQTLTLMVATEPGVPGGRGYLDPDTSRCTPGSASPEFMATFRKVNPHRLFQ